jgi:hypothetical protein
MSRQSTQARERHYFEQFRAHYELPLGEIEYGDKPDVVIRGASVLGIEIANLYLTEGADPASEQLQHRFRRQTLDRALRIHLSAHGRPIELSVDFHPEHPIKDIEPLARSLAQLAQETEGMPSGQIPNRRFTHIRELRFVYRNANDYANPLWRVVQCYRVPDLSLARLREVVAEKSKKAAAYQPCNAYWLLLVVDFMDRSQDQELVWPEGTERLESAFARILLYKPQFAQVLELPQ